MMKEKMRKVFRTDKPILGMIHLGGTRPEEIFDQAKREIALYYENGVDAVLVEDYFGSASDVACTLGYLQRNYPDHVYGINLLGDPERAFAMAHQYGASFMQMDSVCGHLRPGSHMSGYQKPRLQDKTCDGDFAERLAELRTEYPVFLLGGVRFKYQPVRSGRSTEKDLELGMERCDAVVVTGAGTGVETDMGKIQRFRIALGDFPLFIGAGMTMGTCREQLSVADGAIVGSWFKKHGETNNPVDGKRVREFMEIVREIRAGNEA